jgi:hypothetical protein
MVMRGVVQHTWTFKQDKSFSGYFVSVDDSKNLQYARLGPRCDRFQE